MAEQWLLRAQAIDPKGPQPRAVDNTYVVKSISLEEARGAYATEVRKKLEASTDPRLLTAAGRYLIVNAGQIKDKVGFDHIALGRSYLERALQLDPDSIESRRLLAFLKERDRYARSRAAVGDPSDDAKVSALSEADRLESLPRLAEMAFSAAEGAEYYKKDMVSFEASRKRARRFAEESLVLAAKYKGDPRSGAAVYRAHITLGLVAIRRNDRATAVKHMRLAVETPGSLEVAEYADSHLRQRLVNYLLKAGERESVADFLERASTFAVYQKDQSLKDAKAIRDGRMPMGYQYMVTPHEN